MFNLQILSLSLSRVIKYHTVVLSIGICNLCATALSGGLDRCTGRVAQLGDEEKRKRENRDSIEKMAYWWPTDVPYSWGNVKHPGC